MMFLIISASTWSSSNKTKDKRKEITKFNVGDWKLRLKNYRPREHN